MHLCELQLSCVLFGAEGHSSEARSCSSAGAPLLTSVDSTSSRSGTGGCCGAGSSSDGGVGGGPVLETSTGQGVYSSVGTVDALAHGAAARLRLLLRQGMVGVFGGPWWQREAGRVRLD